MVRFYIEPNIATAVFPQCSRSYS